MGRPLVAAAVVGGVAHHAGKVSAQNAAAEQKQSQQIADLQAQNEQLAQQQAQMAQQQQMPQAAPPPQYAPPPPPSPAPAAAPVAAAPSQDDKLTHLTELGQLKASGVLTEEEFEAEKAKILGS